MEPPSTGTEFVNFKPIGSMEFLASLNARQRYLPPVQPGDAQVYEFRAMQYGTAWYHSHYSLQYTNGVLGPIHIKGPSSANYDTDLGPLLFTDWYHDDAFGMFHEELFTPHAPLPVSTLLNGKGIFDCNATEDPRCTGKSERHEIMVQQGKRYKLGLVNTGSLLTYKIWIDGHNFTVIQNDLVPIQPFETDILVLGIAQRYEIIIEANASLAKGSNFWIHALYCDEENFPSFIDSRVGIVRYDPSSTIDPPNDISGDRRHVNHGCRDPDPTDLVPIVPRQVGQHVNGLSPADYLKIGLQSWPNISDPYSRIHKWALSNRTQYIDWRDPSVKRLVADAENPGFDSRSQPIYLDYDTSDWVYFVIENNYTMDSVDYLKTIPRSVHPIHLHGHDFVILAQGDGKFDSSIVPNLNNPARRDVVNCPIGGYVWIAFQINNPGAWLMHCHIAWHASAGLSLQFIEQRHKIKGMMEDANALDEMDERCHDWIEHYSTHNIPNKALQDDSGI
ncbi:Dihydrogeodin oxidase [Lachnellula arida]|uniref:Dihydrogeodin oxidase n=1 Tax=Lachnellula arida TaxID=1316785 RepID=A0A8T9BM90_9HELO|nr:Dihydrogeodin oxidase [Lachnellula arida]